MESRSAPPPCACGHIYAVDFVNKHTNTVYQHTTASSSRKHLEWESRGCPIPVPQCGCGESFVPAPMQQHDQIVAKHRGTRRHLDWVAGGEKLFPLISRHNFHLVAKQSRLLHPARQKRLPLLWTTRRLQRQHPCIMITPVLGRRSPPEVLSMVRLQVLSPAQPSFKRSS